MLCMQIKGAACQRKVKGAGESRIEGRKRAMWKVGLDCVSRFALPIFMTGSSGVYCIAKSTRHSLPSGSLFYWCI